MRHETRPRGAGSDRSSGGEIGTSLPPATGIEPEPPMNTRPIPSTAASAVAAELAARLDYQSARLGFIRDELTERQLLTLARVLDELADLGRVG